MGLGTLWNLISSPIIVNKTVYDGWYFWGLLSIFFLSFTGDEKHNYIFIPSLFYILLLVLSVNQTDIHGRYISLVSSFMTLASSRLLIEISKQKSWFIVVFVLLVSLGEIKFLYEDNFGMTPFVLRLLMAILLAPLFANAYQKG